MDKAGTIPENANELRYHGGNVSAARRLFPNAPEPWLDLSTGINVVPYPVSMVAPSAWSSLPEPSDLAALEDAARVAYGIAPSGAVVAAPGTQALIQWLPRLFPAQRVGVLGFTYAEHETSWRAAGADVGVVATAADLVGYDIGVVVNPNNPDGRILMPNDLASLAKTMAEHGGRLIVDEAFMDVLGRHTSFISRLPTSGAIVLRSFGKIHGLAGLRLGFAVSSPEICMRLRRALGPWAVSGPAIEIGRRALMDVPWLTTTMERLGRNAQRLDDLLQSVGLKVVGGTPLFRLTEHERAAEWFAGLCQTGILTRPFAARPNWLRFGVPDAMADWERLEAAMQRCQNAIRA